ncbi:SAP domain-containing protein [Streptosporangiaceae bacterium NEAU-GS5]|nr:SAP domain-containing protein [Streptosporangiaceae bacterium NEAU-GS5]
MSLATCADCTAAYPGELPACPHCRSTSRGGGSTLPSVDVECRNQDCRACGTVRHVGLRTAAPGVVELPMFLCSGCGLAMYLVSMWRQPAAGTENDMPKIHADREPTHASDIAGPDAEQAEVPAARRIDEIMPPLNLAHDLEPEEAEEPDYASMTVEQLRAELDGRGLTKSGTKAELVARLEADDTAHMMATTEVTVIAEATVTHPDGSKS